MENERNYVRKNMDMLFVKCMFGEAMKCYIKPWKQVANTAIHNIFCKNTPIQIRVDFQILKVKPCQINTKQMKLI